MAAYAASMNERKALETAGWKREPFIDAHPDIWIKTVAGYKAEIFGSTFTSTWTWKITKPSLVTGNRDIVERGEHRDLISAAQIAQLQLDRSGDK